MNADARTLKTRAEDALAAEYAAVRARLPGGERMRASRDAAFALFARLGLPHRRVEAWKYTDLRALLRSAAPLAGPADAGELARIAEADPVGGLDRARIVVVNGAFEPALSDLDGLDGVTVQSLAAVLDRAPERIGRLVAGNDDVVVALNTALMQGGAVVTVAPGARPARAIEIVHLTASPDPAAVFIRDVVEVGADASVRLVESHRGTPGVAYQVNATTELDIGRGAKVVWARLQAESEAAVHLASFFVRVAESARLDHLGVNAGAALARWQAFVAAGRAVTLGFRGATMLSGAEHGDTTLVVDHAEPGSVSRELYKTVIDGRADGAFQGRIVVQPGAQKTDARMMAQALLLSDEGEFASKPELEIFADDVQCGHGSTSGRIDPAMLFYLMARGIPRAEAERLLVEAFLDDAIDALGDEPISEAFRGVVSAWLARRGGAS